jgi:hypothetical protein
MKKPIANILVWIFAMVAILLMGLRYLTSWQLSNSHKETWNAMSEKEFGCPESTKVTIRCWSRAGYMRYCEPEEAAIWRLGLMVIGT